MYYLEFYLEVLKAWKEIRYSRIDSVEDILNQYLFYNRRIRISNKTLYVKAFHDNSILQVKDIINDTGHIKSFHEMNLNPSSFMTYLGLVHAIPRQWKSKCVNGVITVNTLVNECLVDIQGNSVGMHHVRCSQIYDELVVKKITKSKACIKLSECYGISEEDWKGIFMLPYKAKVTNNVKEAQFKIIHGYVATNKLLYKIKIKTSPRCNFCFLYQQDINHVMFECMEVKNFWFDVSKWLFELFEITITFELRNILLGSTEDTCFINNIILYGKYYILKCKYQDISPCIDNFITYITMNINL